jgi:hypothetical protein
MSFLSRKWLIVNEEVTYEVMLNRNNATELMNRVSRKM